MMTRVKSSRPVALVLLLALAALSQGCFNPFDPLTAARRGVSEPAPVPNTAQGVLDLFAWCWNQRAYEEYTEIFTEDFEFRFASADSAGNAYRDRALYRQDELDTARHLFVEGTATEPPATRIALIYQDRNFVPQRDSRPGKAFPWHQEIKRSVVLSIDTQDQQFRINGAARFFLVRGDSAKIPEEMLQRGFGPDVNRWYIERWEDETVGAPGEGGLIAQLPPEYQATVLSRLRRGEVSMAASHEASAASRSSATPKASATPPSTATAIREVTWGRIKYIYDTNP